MAKRVKTEWSQDVAANCGALVNTATGWTTLTGRERGDNRTGAHDVETADGRWISLGGLTKTMPVADVSRILRASVDAAVASLPSGGAR